MKTIKYILYALTATFVLASCSDDIKYTPGEGEDTDCYGVYFPSQENAGDQELDPAEPTTLTFTAMRKNYNDAITVPVEVSSTQRSGYGKIFRDGKISEVQTQVSILWPKQNWVTIGLSSVNAMLRIQS